VIWSVGTSTKMPTPDAVSCVPPFCLPWSSILRYILTKSDFIGRVQALLGPELYISPSWAPRILAANGITHKLIETCFISRSELSPARWAQSQWEIALRARVYVEKAHCCGWSAKRKWASKLRLERTVCYVTNNNGVRTFFFVAMSHDKDLDWLIIQPPPGQSSVDFLLFASDHLLPQKNDSASPWYEQPERRVVLLDNALVHDELALAVMEPARILVCRPSLYSPDFSPTEDIFSVGSSWLCRSVSPEQFNDLPFFGVAAMLLRITPAMCTSFVRAAVKNHCFSI